MTAARKTEPTPADALETEAEQEEISPYVPIPMSGLDDVTKELRALPATRWRASALRLLRTGDFDGFMGSIVHEDDYDTYVDLDPDQEQIGEFADACAEAGAEPLGKSSGPKRSSRSTRRR
ncbi:MAG TPA: hypothetical protein DEQ61_09905 [Streptomyces sp.]|nr:hypothetical protein [Streptomyces sp.]